MLANLTLARRLTATARQLWSTLAPGTSRLAPMRVEVVEADTAYTDGQRWIRLPPTFHGADLSERAEIAVGLLAHELSHFLQPLGALSEARKATMAPKWLANLLADIQGESLVGALFPTLNAPLVAVRTLVGDAQVQGYQDGLAAATSFAEAAQLAAFWARFGLPPYPFAAPAVCLVPEYEHAAEITEFLDHLTQAETIPACDLPRLLEAIMRRFPDLAEPLTSEVPNPLDGLSHDGAGTPEEVRGVAGLRPPASPPESIITQRAGERVVDPVAARLARSLVPRFQARRAEIVIQAPQRLDRRAAAQGAALPFQMQLAGRSRPAPAVVIAVDVSGSMRGAPLERARQAAQALALAVRAAGGQVVGILFTDYGFASVAWDDALLFLPLEAWPSGNTSFAFLAEVWERYPTHQVVVITDGLGDAPLTLPAQRARTSAIAIPPDASVDRLTTFCGRVEVLDDLTRLAALVGLLVPRSSVA